MTVTSHTTSISVPDLESAIAAVRARGLRLSAARRLVLEALYTADGPVSADEIADGLGGRVTRSDLTSVYRNLETLEEMGLVRHVHLGHGPGRYAVAGAEPREHLVCDRCGALRSVAPEDLDDVRDLIRERFGYEARFTHFPIVGLCPRCLAAA